MTTAWSLPTSDAELAMPSLQRLEAGLESGLSSLRLPSANLCSFQSAISKREDLCRTENQYLIFRITLTHRLSRPARTGQRLPGLPLPTDSPELSGDTKNQPQP